MTMILRTCLALACVLTIHTGTSFAQNDASSPKFLLQEAQQTGKFTFLVFYRDNSSPTQTMLQTVKEAVNSQGAQSTMAAASMMATDGMTLAEKFNVTRAPMPMTVAVAPNGAVTGLFSRKVSRANLEAAIVPPVMMECMKQLQEQKLVFVCLTKSEQAVVPTGVQGLRLDPLFKDRMALLALNVQDSAEARLMKQLKVEAQQVQGPYAVLIAPPGVLVGHFNGSSTTEEIAAAIHKAGKCCEDPNCEHASSTQASQTIPTRR